MTNTIKAVTKDPNAVLDYGVRWTPWLVTGETISASSWVVPAGLTADSDDHDDTTTRVWLRGGTAGASYVITNHIVTTAGREDDRSLLIVVDDT